MASASICHYCKATPFHPLKNGWDLGTGESAKLCVHCHKIYKAGMFVKYFIDMKMVGRTVNLVRWPRVHYGCIVSLTDYLVDDIGGIICIKCSNKICQQSLLFEKRITESDFKARKYGLTIPVKHAKAYFPEVMGNGNRILLNILDTDGNSWDVSYGCRVYSGRPRYTLKGLTDFMESKNMQAHDTVIFYRKQLDGKIIIELKKTDSGSSHQVLCRN